MIKYSFKGEGLWEHSYEQLPQGITWDCGYCGKHVASARAYIAYQNIRNLKGSILAAILFCPNCLCPTFVRTIKYDNPSTYLYYPQNPLGDNIQNLPKNLLVLYEEARLATTNGAYTASVMVCRKILMHIGVEQGAQPNQNFFSYVEYLENKGFIPPNGKGWVDYIRTKGNEANHEIVIMTHDDAMRLIRFVEMLLRFIYEFPSMIPPNKP